MAAVHTEGGGVEVDSGGVTMTKSLRKSTAVARPPKAKGHVSAMHH
jgi:hypothetical protein